jgi:hypothetical protein
MSKIDKYEFLFQEVGSLGYVITKEENAVGLPKIETVFD